MVSQKLKINYQKPPFTFDLFLFPVVYRYVLEWRPFVILGRLSFGAYLVNYPLVKAQAGMEYIELNYGYYAMGMSLISTLVMSYFLALVLCLFVELPVSAFLRLIFARYVTEEIDKGVTASKDELTKASHVGSHTAIVDMRSPSFDLESKDENIMEIHKFGSILKSKEEAMDE